MNDMKLIRAAVSKHRGGLESATDAEIITIWNTLGGNVQAAYLDAAKQELKNDTNRLKRFDSSDSAR